MPAICEAVDFYYKEGLDVMKNFLLGLIAFALLGIFLFLGVIIFSSDSNNEVAEIPAEDTVSAETSEDDESPEKIEETSSDNEEAREVISEKDEEENLPAVKSDDETLDAVQLEQKLLEQDVVVENTQYLIQDTEYKALYPDMLSTVIKNNSDTDINNITYGYVAWDDNGLPIRIQGDWDFSGGSYLYTGTGESVNIAPGETHGRNYGFELTEEMDAIHSIKSIVVEYEGFNGEKFENPLLDDFSKIYEGKRLADIEGHEETIFNRFESTSRTTQSSDGSDSDDSSRREAEIFITDYLYSLEEAYALGDFSIIESDLVPRSGAYNQMRENVLNDYFPNLTIYSVEVVEYTESGNNIYVEVLSERTNDNLDHIYEYRTGYNIIFEDGSWKIEKFTDL